MRRRQVIRLVAAGGLAVLAAWAVIHRDDVAVGSLEAWLNDLGPWAPFLFVLAYAVGAVAFLPGSVMTLAGGAVFGPVQGTLLSLTGATTGATAALLVARLLGGEWVARRLQHLGLVASTARLAWRASLEERPLPERP